MIGANFLFVFLYSGGCIRIIVVKVGYPFVKAYLKPRDKVIT